MTVDSIVFDLDGTLWDTCEACAVGWNNVVRRHGIPFREIVAADVRAVTGKPHETCILEAFAGLEDRHLRILVDETSDEDVRVISTMGGVLYPGVAGGLRALARRYPLFIVSNCQSGYIETFLRWSDLGPIVRDFECWGNTGRPKADNLADIVRRNALARPVYVGDTSGDEAAARGAGVPFAFVSYGFGNALAPDLTFDTFDALVAHFTTRL